MHLFKLTDEQITQLLIPKRFVRKRPLNPMPIF